MNDARRKAIEAIKAKVEEANALLAAIKEDLETIQGEEQEYFDNMPESLQGGDKGQKAEAAAEALTSAVDQADNAINELEQIGDYLDTASE